MSLVISKKSKIIIAIASVIIVLTLAALFIQNEQAINEENIFKEYREVQPPDEYKAEFEKKIAELMGLATNDYTLGFGGPFKIDMSSREKYFTREAWKEYRAYESDHKKFLRSLKSQSVYASPNWDYQGKQNKYLKEINHNKDMKFIAKGKFYYMKEGDLAMGSLNAFD